MARKKLIPRRSGERGDAGVEKEGPSPSSAPLSPISPLPQHMQPAKDPGSPWPELDGRRIGAYAPCQRCGRGSWVYYGDTVLCLRHAKEVAFVAALVVAGISPDDIAVVVEIVRVFGAVELVEVRPRACCEPQPGDVAGDEEEEKA